MHELTIGDFLGRLAARTPAPGGGAGAALNTAQAAALLGMVARYSDGPRYAEHAELTSRIRAEADTLRDRAVGLAGEDGRAFDTVAAAYRLPTSTDEQKAVRSTAIAAALVVAARPPAAVISLAQRLVELAEQLVPVANRSVIADLGAAAEAARAAAAVSRLNVEANLAGITDAQARTELTATIAAVDDLLARAGQITAAVRREISR